MAFDETSSRDESCSTEGKDTPGRRRLVVAESTRETLHLPGPGMLLDDRYHLEEELGRGGMGIVYRAHDQELDIHVAIKVLPPELAHSSRAVADLKREAIVAMGLRHPSIVALHHFGDAGPTKFLVMELLEGESLDDRLGKEGKLPESLVVDYASALGRAMDYAHEEGVVHRDIKPANVFLHRRGGREEVRLTDFGIARQLRDSLSRVSRQETTGTLLYMSPEQLQGSCMDSRSDIYSLAATLYECLAGHPPFHTGAISHQIVHVDPRPISGVSPCINHALLAGLAKHPDSRPPTAGLLARAMAGEVVELPPVVRTASREPKHPSLPSTNRNVMTLFFLLFFLMCMVVLSVFTPPRSSSAPVHEEAVEEMISGLDAEEQREEPDMVAGVEVGADEDEAVDVELVEVVTEAAAASDEPVEVREEPIPSMDDLLLRIRQALAADDMPVVHAGIGQASQRHGSELMRLFEIVDELSEEGEYARAIRFVGALPEDIQTAEVWLVLGIGAFEARDASTAANALTKAWMIDSDAHEAYYYLALICEADPARHDRALEYVEQALELEPSDEDYRALRRRILRLLEPKDVEVEVAMEPSVRISSEDLQQETVADDDRPTSLNPLPVTLHLAVTKRGNHIIRRVTVAVISTHQAGPHYTDLVAELNEASRHRRTYTVELPEILPGTYNVFADIAGAIPVYGIRVSVRTKRVSWPNVKIVEPGDVVLSPDARTD